MDKEVRSTIKGYLEGFITGLLNEVTKTDVNPTELRPLTAKLKPGNYKPFHQALLPEGLLRSLEFERKFSTRLGGSFEEAARLIAEGAGYETKRGYKITGGIYDSVFNDISTVVNKLRETGKPDDYPGLIKQISRLSKEGNKRDITVAVDFYVKIKQTEYYFEIKSPKPNKGQCLEVLERLLRIYAIRDKSKGIKPYYAMPYNPYGEKKSDYGHWVGSFIDMENMVLLGKEFWDLIGGRDTYEELLSIYLEVGREKGPDIIDRLMADY